MDKNESYFRRTFWFVWIGYATSLISFLAIGSVGTLNPKDQLLQIQTVQWTVVGLAFVAAAIAGHFLFQSIKTSLQVNARFTSTTSESVEAKVGNTGMALVRYIIMLSLIEAPAVMAFVIGFLGADFSFMVPFIGIALLLMAFAVPSRCLPNPQHR